MRFRFTIRDLLWLAVVVALAVGWWIDHQRLQPKMMLVAPAGEFDAGPIGELVGR